MEGRLVARVMSDIARRDNLPESEIELLRGPLSSHEQIDGLGFCLSEIGDLLSQWRGYAEDAKGVSVGFSMQFLEDLAELSRSPDGPGSALGKVEYDQAGHEGLVAPMFREARRLIDDGAFKHFPYRTFLCNRTDEEIEIENRKLMEAHGKLFIALLPLLPKLYFMKTPAFHEEREWRLVSYHVPGVSDSCSYRVVSDRVIPYRSFELRTTNHSAIMEVILGPKHVTPPKVVADLLKRCGFGNVPVRRSEASYR